MSVQEMWSIFIVAALLLMPGGLEGGWNFIMLWYWHFRANAAQRLSERLEGAVVKRRWAEEALARAAREGTEDALAAVRVSTYALESAIKAKQNINFESNSGRFKVQFALYKDVQANEIEHLFKSEFGSCNCGKCQSTNKRRR